MSTRVTEIAVRARTVDGGKNEHALRAEDNERPPLYSLQHNAVMMKAKPATRFMEQKRKNETLQ